MKVRARISLVYYDLGRYARRPLRIEIGDLLNADDPVVLANPEHFVAVGV